MKQARRLIDGINETGTTGLSWIFTSEDRIYVQWQTRNPGCQLQYFSVTSGLWETTTNIALTQYYGYLNFIWGIGTTFRFLDVPVNGDATAISQDSWDCK